MNKILYWNAILLEASRRDHSQGYFNGQNGGPTATSRAMAIVHLAMHDAVAYVSKPAAAYQFKKDGVTMVTPAGVKVNDVIDGAAFTSLNALYPAYSQYFEDALANVAQIGFDFGATIAQTLLASRATDGFNLPAPPPRPIAYGVHRVDPYDVRQGFLSTQWGGIRHFVGPRTALAPPPATGPTGGSTNYLTDSGYRQDYDEVIDYGSRDPRMRTPDQTAIGTYWGYDGAQGIGVPPRLYNQIARRISASQSLSLNQTAELFAQLNVAMADSAIDAWHWKYEYALWRPVVGVRHEPAPDGDPFWAPLGAPQTNRVGVGPRTPAFPAYPSGHATFGAALFQTLRLRATNNPLTVAEIMDADDGGSPVAGEAFDFVSDELDGRAIDADGSVRTKASRSFTNFARPVWENAISRVYIGVHWRFDGLPRNAADNIGGVPLGLNIGQKVHDFFRSSASL